MKRTIRPRCPFHGRLLPRRGHTVLRVAERQQAQRLGEGHVRQLRAGRGGLRLLGLQLHHLLVGGIGHRRLGAGHVDRVDADAVRRIVDGCIARQPGDGVLAGHVGRVAGQPDQPGDRAYVDDGAAAPLGQHLPQLAAHRFEQAADVDVHHPVPVVVAGLVNRGEDQAALPLQVHPVGRRHAVHHARAVDHAVQAAEGRDRVIDHALAIVVAAYVHRHEDRPAPFGLDVSQGLPALGFQIVGHDHVRSLARRALGGGAADAPGASGDQQCAAGEAAGEGLVGVDGLDVARRRVQGSRLMHEGNSAGRGSVGD